MAWTELQICNMALSHIGQEPITAADFASPVTKAGRLCNTFYANCRDQINEALDWPFGIVSQELIALNQLDSGEWVFGLPDDCARAIDVVYPKDVDWREESDGTLLASVEALTLRYVQTLVDTTLFTASFVDHVATLLAFKISIGLALPSMTKIISVMAGPQLIARTRPAPRRGQRIEPGEESPWITARR